MYKVSAITLFRRRKKKWERRLLDKLTFYWQIRSATNCDHSYVSKLVSDWFKLVQKVVLFAFCYQFCWRHWTSFESDYESLTVLILLLGTAHNSMRLVHAPYIPTFFLVRFFLFLLLITCLFSLCVFVLFFFNRDVANSLKTFQSLLGR